MSEVPATDSAAPRKAEPAVVYAAPADKRISVGAPSLLALANGKLLVAFDQTGPDVKGLSGKKGNDTKRGRWMQGRVMASTDGGTSWQLAATYPFRRASLFREGGDVYLLGEAAGGLCLMRSPDGGASWSAPMELTGDLDLWLTPTALLATNEAWLLPCLIPVENKMALAIFRAPRGASLMHRKAWTQGPPSAPLSDLIAAAPRAGCGVPAGSGMVTWREPVLLAISDGRHPWHDEQAVHVVGATSSGRQHWAALFRVALPTLTIEPQSAPTGEPWVWLPLPGGHDKFDVFYDAPSRAYWVAGARGVPGLPLGREVDQPQGLRRIGLWTSDNLAEWDTVATLVAGGDGPAGVRCDPALAVAGNDLVWACRAGGEHSRNVRETTRILCGRLPNFRARPTAP